MCIVALHNLADFFGENRRCLEDLARSITVKA